MTPSTFDSGLLTKSSNHSRTRPTTLTPLIHPRKRIENIFLIHTRFARFIQFIRKDIQHQLAVAICVDMAMRLLVEMFPQFARVHEVTIVCEADTVGTVDVEWLRFGTRVGACGGIAEVANAH